MIRKMQQKFVAVVMLAYMILMLIVIGGINLFTYIQMNQKYDKMLDVLLKNDGEFPDPDEYNHGTYIDLGGDFMITVETKFENRYFMVYMDQNGEYSACDISHVAAVSEDDAQAYAKHIFKKTKSGSYRKGTYAVYRYRLERTDSGYTAAFVDMSQQIFNMKNIRVISVGIGGLLMFLLFGIVQKLSRKAIHPIIENMEKQKQFITDAGHELKTPLAVISANADVLELTAGKNEWIDSIRDQVTQMNELVKRLLFLSKMEEGQQLVMTDFDFSKLVAEKAKQLSTIAISKEKEFETEIQDDIQYKGDMDAIEHLISVLTENAVKYCAENGKVQVRLFKSGKMIHFEVRNSSQPLEESEMGRLFERFYRPDSSRNRTTGGHGIGLSIAKAVVDSHRGKIYVKNEPGMVAFCVELQQRPA